MPKQSGIRAIEDLFNDYYPALCFFAQHYLDDAESAEDVVQEIFVFLLNDPQKLKEIDSIRSFLYKTVKNKCLNQLKHNQIVERFRQSEVEKKAEESFFTDHLIEEETHRLLHQAIEALPEKCREVINLSLKGLKNNEVAGVLDISVNTVKTRKKTAYEQLRLQLKSAINSFHPLF